MATYNLDLLITFLASLRTKSFVILTGMSGTGKTSLVENFVEDLYPDNKSEYYEFVPVKPNWTDSNPLLGFYNPLMKEFIPGKLTKIITKSYGDRKNPYFILLDEINLARVEYYLAELLSLMETIKNGESNFLSLFTFSDDEFDTTEEKEKFIKKLYNTGLLIKDKNNNIYTPNLETDDNQSFSSKNGVYEAGYKISNNLFIIGTANIDETTYGFSNKVLDRCNVIEVENTLGSNKDEIELREIVNNNTFKNFLIEKKYIDKKSINENLLNFYEKYLKEFYKEYLLDKEFSKEVNEFYKNLGQFKFKGNEKNNEEINISLYSHRVYNDILHYLDSIDKLNLDKLNNKHKMSNENYYLYPILQKVLPKIKGIGGKDSETYQVLEAIKNKLNNLNNKDKIIKKIEQMQNGDFITFWK